MGKLRIVPAKEVMKPERFKAILNILKNAEKGARDSHIFYDLDKEENGAQVRKDFLYVAQKEGIPLSIKKLRKSNSLELIFKPGEKKSGRMSAEVYKKRVLDVLAESKVPMKKGAIIEKGELNGATWNVRITELVENGDVNRKGSRRQAVYSLP